MITNADFVHLHNHTEFSRFDGLAKIDSFTLTAKLMGFQALGITDHGNIGGWLKFYQSCSAKKKKYKIDYLTDRELLKATKLKYTIHKDKKGQETEIELENPAPLKPILGEEFYLARKHDVGGREGNPDGRKGNRHILLIARNQEGYKNICALSQRSWTHGQGFGDPRIDLELLSQHSEGVICSSACLGSVINNNLLHGRYAQAKKVATLLKDIFGKYLYLSTMFHGIEDEAAIIGEQIKLAKELDILLVAENDCHCCTKNQMKSQELLMAMSTSRCIKDPKRMRYSYPELYMKSAEDMHKIYGHNPEVLSNTRVISEMIEDVVKRSDMRLPVFDIETARQDAVLLKFPTAQSDHDDLVKKLDSILESIPQNPSDEDKTFEKAYSFVIELMQKGVLKLKWQSSEPHINAIKKELNYLRVAWESNRMDFPTYFLIIWDIINFARKEGILTGCGRGSGYASLILRALGITYGPDPIEHGLIFERFLGFDERYYLSDRDWGFDEAEDGIEVDSSLVVDTEEENDELMEERLVEDDLGGADRY